MRAEVRQSWEWGSRGYEASWVGGGEGVEGGRGVRRRG